MTEKFKIQTKMFKGLMKSLEKTRQCDGHCVTCEYRLKENMDNFDVNKFCGAVEIRRLAYVLFSARNDLTKVYP